MNNFTYIAADTPKQAANIISQNPDAAFIAGGTNLIDLMKENIAKPNQLIDLNKIPGLDEITELPDAGLRLGALARNADTAYHPLVQERYPLLADAILAGASAQLRNMATNGGNLLQRTRCYYFYDIATPCNKREPGSGCAAYDGYNRMNAILGSSEHCVAVFPSDMCVALAALNATVNVSGATGERQIPFNEFHRLPGDTPQLDNNLQHGEIITSIDLPPGGLNKNYSYLKLRDRTSYAFALVSIATAFELKDGLIVDARIALGGVAHKPWRVTEAEEFLKNKQPAKESFTQAATLILKGAVGLKHNAFKIELAKRAIVRNCLTALNPDK
ncbi:xanthine dehydrogenase family protein subunit M [Mucilaginibacter pallidiroseus]|uniref:Xanthine dehydrogenase family protein subunit M n=1 Tax=Mucilaginibacter pallidiroseus TaxID=2599295 RepID=A0A563UC89_9SPHI|nr:xanthine dehydrogenase family protein subunit M [Mucilaginibacter pallidiroseus]TWR28940.1 xanthine dehydrogenase family protein subunit M [Mucilaginibacter pallidiroseus]